MERPSEIWHDPDPMKRDYFFENIETHLQTMLDRELQRGNRKISVTGSSSPALVSLLLANTSSKDIESLPHLVVTSSYQDAEKFQRAIEFFDSARNVYLLSSFDVSPSNREDFPATAGI